MSLRVKHLNADTSFLLIFSPACAPHNPQGTFPGSFTILIDPWLSGSSTVLHDRFAHTTHRVGSAIESLAELPDPDLVIVSQDKPDHCHGETLRQLPSDTAARILGPPAAVKKIRSWKHFDPLAVQPLPRYDDHRQDATIYRIPLDPYSASGAAGEVSITRLAPKMDLKGLKNAIAVTYRPPSSVLSVKTGSYVNLPLTPPSTPPSSTSSNTRPITPVLGASSTVYPSPTGSREKTLSVIYTPHGLSYEVIKPYASTHLLSEAALPLTALFHSFDRSENPWYLGGNITAGMPGGLEIARSLFAKAWISAHDEDKANTGLSVKGLKTTRYNEDEIRKKLDESSGRDLLPASKRRKVRTQLMALEAGEECFIQVT